jgi:hypothetical protein
MRNQRIRSALLAFLAVTVLAATASLLGAYHGMQPGQTPTRLVRNHVAHSGAVLDWPAEPPMPWPSPAQVAVTRGRFSEHANAIAVTDGLGTHQMEVWRYGWPLRIFTESRRAWPLDDPRWRTDARPETGLQISWINLGLPALGAGAIAGGLVLAFGAWRTRRMRRAGRCVRCGHRLHDQRRCPECGELTPSAGRA